MKKLYFLILILIGNVLVSSASVEPTPLLPRIESRVLNTGEYKIPLPNRTLETATIETIEEAELFYDFPEVDAILADLERQNFDSGAMIIQDDMSDVFAKEQEYAGNPDVQKAAGIFSALTENKLIEKLTGGELIELPVGIRKTFGNTTFTFAISEVIIHPDYMQATAYVQAELPSGKTLWFGTDNLKFTSDGGIIGDATLGLFGDFPLTRGTRKIAVVLKKFIRDSKNKSHKGCYVTVDCNGFVDMRVDADLLITREWILPTDSNGELLSGNDRVKAEVGITLTDWDDFVADITIPYFTLTKNTKTAFIVDDCVIDLSDVKNAPGFVPPPPPTVAPGGDASNPNDLGLTGTGTLPIGNPTPPAPELWRGVFFKKIEIVLPKVWGNQDSLRTKAGAENLYIQSAGITGDFYLENVIKYDTTKMQGKWKFSLDEVRVKVFYNDVYGFNFNGRLGIPIAKDTKPFEYYGGGNIKKDQYYFGLAVADSMEFPLFKTSRVELYPNTKIHVDIVEGKFKPVATISGLLDINAKHGDKTIEVGAARFEKLIVQTEAPYLGLETGGSVTLTTGAILNNSFLQINEVGLYRVKDDEVKLGFSFNASLMSEEDGGVGAGGKFGIVAKLKEDEHKWKFDRVDVDGVSIDISIGSHVRINGEIETFTGHPVYGDGWKGSLSGGFIESADGFKFALAANWCWGEVNDFKYWSFDAFVSGEVLKVPIVPGLLYANGFGGGAYHHMKMADFNTAEMVDDLGNPSSGITYEPDEEIALGIKASVGLTNNAGSFQGIATLELAFSGNMVLNQIYFYGAGEFIKDDMFPGMESRMTEIPKSKSVAEAADKAAAQKEEDDKIKAAVMLNLDFSSGFVLQGSFEAFLSAAQGRIKGHGMIDLYAATETGKWHLYIGGYTDNSITNGDGQVIPPVTASVDFGSFEVQVGAYFMTGNDIPGPPPIMPQVASFFNISQNQNNRDILETGGRSPALGTGFAFGAYAHFEEKTEKGTCRKGFIRKDKYIDIEGGAGFDISLLKYQNDTQCSKSGDSPHGMKGWRAGGRLWFYLSVKARWSCLGACVSLPRINAGILLDGDLPKPSFFRAVVRLEIIGIKVNATVKIGDECGVIY